MDHYRDLIDLLKTLKKNPKRVYSDKTIILKKNLCKELIDKITLENKESKQLIIQLEDIKREIYFYLEQGQEEHTIESMSDFNLELSFKIVPEFKGSQQELTPFLKIVKIIYDTLKTEAKTTFIDFVKNVKLNSTVRTSIGTNICENYETLEKLLYDRYKSSKTISQIQSELTKIRQRNDSVREFSNKILQLVAELNELQIKEFGFTTEESRNNVMRINESYSLNIFKQGLNEKYLSTIFAAQPKTFNDAVTLSMNIEGQIPEQVMFYRRDNWHNNNNNRNNNNNQNRNKSWKTNKNNASNNGDSQNANNNYNNGKNNNYNNKNKRYNNRRNNNRNYDRNNVHVVQENSENPEETQ